MSSFRWPWQPDPQYDPRDPNSKAGQAVTDLQKQVLAQKTKNDDAAAAALAATKPVAPPPTAANASAAVETAKQAADRQKKRAAGGSLLVGGTPLATAPVARMAPRTLLGS